MGHEDVSYMGFPVLWGNENGTYADFDVDGHKLAIFSREPMAEAIHAEKPAQKSEGKDYMCLVFAVEEVDREYNSLLGKGVDLLNQPHDRNVWDIRCFHLRDPDGNLIEINRDFGIVAE